MARLLPYGPAAWLVEVDAADVVGYARAVHRAADPAVAEVVPAARTVLVQVTHRGERERIGEWLAGLAPAARDPAEAPAVVELLVVYDGPDLAAVAAASAMGVSEVIERHCAGSYVAAFCGFAPGFAYLTGLDPALHLPRRATPRTRVPAGAVAVAAEYTAAYPSPSPGGWHLIGSTDSVLWDPARDRPSLIRPGDAVRFVAVG